VGECVVGATAGTGCDGRSRQQARAHHLGDYAPRRIIPAAASRRTFDSCLIPHQYARNTLPLVLSTNGNESSLALLCANFNALILDYVARQKVQKNPLNWYVVEQLPVVPLDQYVTKRFGKKTSAEIVRGAVLELTYTANDMAPFARDMGYVDGKGKVKAPIKWDEDRRRMLRAKLDAVYFHLYGVTDRDNVRYIYSTFGIIEREEIAAHGRYPQPSRRGSFLGDEGAGIRRNSPRHSIDCHMTRGPCTFRQKDVTRALRATVAAGIEVRRIEIDKDGKIIVVAGKLPESPRDGGDQRNEWDAVK
jgi:hypothetical protein